MTRKPRYLCICNSGSVRSVTLARMLKKFGAETLSCGWKDNSSETLALLCEWADRIFVAEAPMVDRVPEQFRGKVSAQYACGPDFWFVPAHADLVALYRVKLEANSPGPTTASLEGD